MTNPSVSTILEDLAAAGKAYDQAEPGAREALIDRSRALVAALEMPSEFIQRSFWAEPAMSAIIRIAVDVKLFQLLRDAGEAGLSPSALAAKTGVDVVLLQRLTRHLVAMYLISFHHGAFHGTPLSDQLAADNYQDSISFCYDTARPSFNNFPTFFQNTHYQSPPVGSLNGPFQSAHRTPLHFFDWLVANPPNLPHFDSFMSAYRAGKANWCDRGFYPVADRLIAGFDTTSAAGVLLVDVGGGRGHDVTIFAQQYPTHPGRIILQDREPVIAALDASAAPTTPGAFTAQAHDFFTPQPVAGARAYYLHSILHDWDDDRGIQILRNLVPALRRGYSRVLLNEIVVSEERPTLAATSMDLMMLAHFAVRERTAAEWRAILAAAGLRVVQIYTYPGVAESLIEAELA
ncbi:putative O-methyltransferase [Aspergillus japonicus CBS 114.51]|uniref:Putative O-methyltransferase n=2 Tax=Aspergillus TaxID=5052 RepID=A0A2V5I7P6_ASPV1|nr:putative O-methyltransferase [Aspergillus japonicus CBS 114.51]PYI15646.1 putative O-methyltransferase [Aspergillus violaceofuscus CBS 115571]RAH87455.1 putative O-methyltransferase [Aspergillus japonicus CBS 114.51]